MVSAQAITGTEILIDPHAHAWSPLCRPGQPISFCSVDCHERQHESHPSITGVFSPTAQFAGGGWAVRRGVGRRSAVLLVLGIAEEGRQVLSLSEEPDDVDVISDDEVEPAAREVRHAPEPQPWNSAQLFHAWRAGSWHASDRVERGDRCPEEPFTELVAAFEPVVARAFDEIGLGERAESSRDHPSSNARSRSSAMT